MKKKHRCFFFSSSTTPFAPYCTPPAMPKRARPAADATLPAASGSLLEMEAAELLGAAAFGEAQYASPALRAFLVDDKTRRVLAWREFRAEAVSATEAPQGGVAAANQAVQTVLTELAQFVAAQPR